MLWRKREKSVNKTYLFEDTADVCCDQKNRNAFDGSHSRGFDEYRKKKRRRRRRKIEWTISSLRILLRRRGAYVEEALETTWMRNVCVCAARVRSPLSLSHSLFSLFFLKTYARLHTQPVTLSCCNARALHCRRKDDDDDGDNDDDDDDDLRQESVPTEGKINPYAEERPRSSTVSRLHQSSHYCC